MKHRLSLFIALLLLGFPIKALEVGQPIPAYLGKTLAGEPILPESLQGKVLVISFWASWCPPCHRELPYLLTLQSTWGSEKVQVLAINYLEDDHALKEHSQRFAETEVMQGRDRKGIISRMLAVDGIPHTLIVDQKGIVAHIHSGFYPNTGDMLLSEVAALLSD